MITLQDAWNWYESTALSIQRIERIARRYWDSPALRDVLGKDSLLRDLTSDTVEDAGKQSREPLDDLAVMVLFSVFEANVRGLVAEQVKNESEGLRHAALRYSALEALRAIEEGSFFRVLEPYKDRDAGLIEEVNQVRRYRNWVAHGRRGYPRDSVDPKTAYDRLSRFLQLLMSRPQDQADTDDR